MYLLVMGGIEGRRYYPSKVAQARANSNLRYYQKYIKPELDKQVDPAKLGVQALAFTGGVATSSNPKDWLEYAEKAGNIYDQIKYSSEIAEQYRMRNNAPGDLSGMAYKGATRIYNN